MLVAPILVDGEVLPLFKLDIATGLLLPVVAGAEELDMPEAGPLTDDFLVVMTVFLLNVFLRLSKTKRSTAAIIAIKSKTAPMIAKIDHMETRETKNHTFSNHGNN